MATDMYIDQIAIGGPNNSGFLPYSYMNGTSMATPIVTGAAAIVSSGIDASSPAERAALTVQMLKGAVHQAPGYQGFCKQNGQLDLSLLSDAENLIPEIESAQVVGDTLVVLGNFFGSQGKLLLGDDEANVLSWAEDAIEVALSAGLKSGLIPVTVRTGEGAEVCRAFIIEIPSETGGGLYEDDLTPIALRTDNLSATGIPKDLVASEDGVLYAVPEDSDNRTYSAMRCLMYSEDQGKSWQSIDLPVELKDVSLAVDGGKVYMRGGIPADKSYSEDYWQLYSYDISTGEFALIIESDASLNDEEHFSYHGSLAYVAGQLYFVDLHAVAKYPSCSVPTVSCLD
ncbi:MAG: S8 family serine peptidase [Atopobiaceae bacterium]|nr:S8 family serine peptidase [Atopobiaceae bacterium]